MLTDELALRREIEASPNDPHCWLIYADWLEESGQGPAADKVREMAGQLPVEWKQNSMDSELWATHLDVDDGRGYYVFVWRVSGHPPALFRRFEHLASMKAGTSRKDCESLIPLAILHHAGLAWDVDPPAAGG